jgi:hypothetical protein
MVRIDGIILTLRQPRLIARLLQLQFPLSALGGQVRFQLLQDSEPYLYAHRGDGFQKGFHDRCIDRARGHALANLIRISIMVAGLTDVSR